MILYFEAKYFWDYLDTYTSNVEQEIVTNV